MFGVSAVEVFGCRFSVAWWLVDGCDDTGKYLRSEKIICRYIQQVASDGGCITKTQRNSQQSCPIQKATPYCQANLSFVLSGFHLC